MSFLCLWSARHRRAQDSIFSFSSFVSTFSLKVWQYCPTHPPNNKGGHLLQMLQQVSILSYISPGSFLGKSMTGELVYNFPLLSMYFTYTLLRIPKTDAKNCTVTFTRITVLKRCSALVIWKRRTIDQRTFLFIDYAD